MHGLDRIENVFRRRVAVNNALQLMREHIEQHLGVRVGAQMPTVFVDQQLGELVDSSSGCRYAPGKCRTAN